MMPKRRIMEREGSKKKIKMALKQLQAMNRAFGSAVRSTGEWRRRRRKEIAKGMNKTLDLAARSNTDTWVPFENLVTSVPLRHPPRAIRTVPDFFFDYFPHFRALRHFPFSIFHFPFSFPVIRFLIRSRSLYLSRHTCSDALPSLQPQGQG